MFFFVSRLDKSLSSSSSSSSRKSSKMSPTSKDFETAFATLSGRYGLSSAPILPKKKTTTTKASSTVVLPSAPTPSPASSTTSLYMPGLTYDTSSVSSTKTKAGQKDFEAALGSLQSSYGFSGSQFSSRTSRQTSK